MRGKNSLRTAVNVPRSILLKWTLPEWLQYGFVKDFRIYRCSTASGTCVPTALYATVDDPQIISHPARSQFADADVEPGTVYCYRVTFTRTSVCDSQVVHESPYSNTECSTTCCPPSNGPFWTDYGGTAQELAEWIVGPGFTVRAPVPTRSVQWIAASRAAIACKRVAVAQVVPMWMRI